ncbi:MAG: Histidyl-tRNA synthetase [Candidatus Woesebacteria bacterium GW2011_GWB1_43_14]|uniref:Histidine--tRNA ligase n=1 Tax=Candidatus Woesebacteria bacterium GW2011_GWB1_43_14 TaxID=1618578 RepID=A0A0G1FPG7_9BACT|nr:MAG: histidyl-tRNA synthetase, histidyl-tRNA synthetase [Candidatus Woesebacteria bacterium GW2011_GWC1_42_9]KKS96926.1 MAG: Histidyl-tRNA synthetase [Candidatus Woesebacteria bacterium GW2011_GWB1_43_14]
MKSASNFKGTRDYSGTEVRLRDFVISEIRSVFESFGFEPLETPVLELKSTLTGKYGEEAENLLFYLDRPFNKGGLRYDHTVPLARFAASKWNELPKPYKRYSLGPVFRGENPQAGRLRQFVQCDFDTLGSTSPLVDAEIAAITNNVLNNLGLAGKFEIQVNDRCFLDAALNEIGFKDKKEKDKALRAWDKIEKIGTKEATKSLGKEFQKITAEMISGTEVSDLFTSKNSKESLQKITDLLDLINDMGVPDKNIRFNPLLARGLSYYTGPIFETVVKDSEIGSISGGGRYDKLISDLGGPDVPASGSSFGVERLLFVLEKLEIRPKFEYSQRILVTIFGEEFMKDSVKTADYLREKGLIVELYSDYSDNISKQLKYANKKKFDYAVIIGEEEKANGKITAKNLKSSEQQQLAIEDFSKLLK